MSQEKDKTDKPVQMNTEGGASVGGSVDAGGDFIGREQLVQGDVVKGNKIVIHTVAPSSLSAEQPAQVSPRWQRAITINTILTGIVTFLAAILTNIATGVLPESWKPYLWLAWPLAVLLTGISIWLTLRQSSLEDGASPVTLSVERNRQAILRQVRLDWIDGVLRKSLYQEALISLGLEERPDAIARPFDAQVQRPNQQAQSLPAGTKIIDVFDQFGGSLLILGAPGAGKTTMLLELARDLLDRAEQDEQHLIPVVFNLSSWAVKRQLLAEWLVEELNTKYHIPRKVAHVWVDNEQILPLLDGLDEVAAAYRTSCIEAINAFCRIHNLTGVVVCSRIVDYEALKTTLSLQTAVLVQPLTRQQADEHLKKLGKPLDGVRAALRDDPALWDLIENPLWLSIVTLSYQGLSPQKLRAATTPEKRRDEVLTAYIQAMFKRRGKEAQYAPQQTIAWLTWLSTQMLKRSQTVFLIERLQPDWLDNRKQFPLYSLVVGLAGGLAGWLLFGLLFGQVGWLLFGQVGWQVFGQVFGLVFGLAVGLLFGLHFRQVNKIKPYVVLNFSWEEGLLFGQTSGLFVGLLFVLLFVLLDGLIIGLIIGLFGGLFVGLFDGLLVGLLFGLGRGRSVEVEITNLPNQGIRQSLKNGLVVGLVGGSLFGLAVGLTDGLVVGLLFGLTGWLVLGMAGGLDACIQHFSLRWMLYRDRRMPWNYARFLDYCHDRIFLRRVGGGYIFIHRLVMEHFASLTDEDIARIAGDVKR